MNAPDLENLDSQRKEAKNIHPEDARSGDKKLARGLEDVSYLFLSQESEKSAEKAEEQNVVPEKVPAESPPIRTPILLRPSSTVRRELVISLLSQSTAVLEEGMHVIDTSIPCDPFGVIDLMALDKADQLCIINVDAALSDESFLRGVAQFDWMVRNTPVVRRMYQGRVINFSVPPRLFLVAPGFSPLLKCASRHSSSPIVRCFEYRAAAISGGVGLFFECV